MTAKEWNELYNLGLGMPGPIDLEIRRNAANINAGLYNQAIVNVGISKLSKTTLFGRGNPEKLNRASRLQPYERAGKWLPYEANPGLNLSPIGRFSAGYSQGLAEAHGASGTPYQVGTAGKAGYWLGRVTGAIF